jgi:hypothetical protein
VLLGQELLLLVREQERVLLLEVEMLERVLLPEQELQSKLAFLQ